MSKVDSNWKICLLEKIVRVFFFVIILFFLAGPPGVWRSVAAGGELLSSPLLSPLSKREDASVRFGDSPRRMTDAVAPLRSGVKSAGEMRGDCSVWNVLQHAKSCARYGRDGCVSVSGAAQPYRLRRAAGSAPASPGPRAPRAGSGSRLCAASGPSHPSGRRRDSCHSPSRLSSDSGCCQW